MCAQISQSDLKEKATEETKKALEYLDRRELHLLRAMSKPPEVVWKVLEAVMILLYGQEKGREEVMRMLRYKNFMPKLQTFDLDSVPDDVLQKVGQYVAEPDFNTDAVIPKSLAAVGLCKWVLAVESYGRTSREAKGNNIA